MAACSRLSAFRAEIRDTCSAPLFLSLQLAGDRIFFVSNLSGRHSVWAMDVGGSVPEPLLPPGVALLTPKLVGCSDGQLAARQLPAGHDPARSRYLLIDQYSWKDTTLWLWLWEREAGARRLLHWVPLDHRQEAHEIRSTGSPLPGSSVTISQS